MHFFAYMQAPLQITFRSPISPSRAIHERVVEHVAKLESFFDRIVGCHVTLGSPHHHHDHGNHYTVHIEIAVPGHTLNIARDPEPRAVREDLYAAIDDAFTNAERVLKEYIRRSRRAMTDSTEVRW